MPRIDLERLSDDELRSLIGQSHAELRHREQVRGAEFKEAVRLIEERERHKPAPFIQRMIERGQWL